MDDNCSDTACNEKVTKKIKAILDIIKKFTLETALEMTVDRLQDPNLTLKQKNRLQQREKTFQDLINAGYKMEGFIGWAGNQPIADLSQFDVLKLKRGSETLIIKLTSAYNIQTSPYGKYFKARFEGSDALVLKDYDWESIENSVIETLSKNPTPGTTTLKATTNNAEASWVAKKQ